VKVASTCTAAFVPVGWYVQCLTAACGDQCCLFVYWVGVSSARAMQSYCVHGLLCICGVSVEVHFCGIFTGCQVCSDHFCG